MKTRLKKSASQVPVPQTRADMENLIGQIATLKCDECAVKNLLDYEIAAVKKSHEDSLNEIAAELKPLLVAAETWAANNPAEFGKNKSIKMLHGTVGFRTGTPKVALLSKWTWAKVLESLKGFTFWSDCVRKKEEVDKEKIISRFQTNHGGLDLTIIGVKIVQEESFFVEAEVTPVEKRETKEAK